jgi:hypothetical protein
MRGLRLQPDIDHGDHTTAAVVFVSRSSRGQMVVRSEEEFHLATCEVCGNEYDKRFELIAAAARHTFDSFECAILAIL